MPFATVASEDTASKRTLAITEPAALVRRINKEFPVLRPDHGGRAGPVRDENSRVSESWFIVLAKERYRLIQVRACCQHPFSRISVEARHARVGFPLFIPSGDPIVGHALGVQAALAPTVVKT